jgi:hypothetical protein
MLKSEHSSQHYYLEDSLLKTFPQQIATISGRIEGITKDIATYIAQKEKCNEVTIVNGAASVSSKFLGMIINDVTYTEKETAGHALLDACKRSMDRTDTSIGEYMGFKLSLNFDSFTRQIKLNMRGSLTYQLELGTDTFGNITRLNHALDDLPKRLENMQKQLNTLYEQQESAKAELEIPFEQEDELNSKESRLALLNTELNIGGDGDFVIDGDTESNDKTEAEQNSDVQSETLSATNYSATDKSSYTEPRTGTYGKTAPSFLDNIRSLGERKRENAPSNGKSPDLEI